MLLTTQRSPTWGAFALGLLLAACGEASGAGDTGSNPDVAIADTRPGVDAAPDAGAADVPAMDAPRADTPSGDVASGDTGRPDAPSDVTSSDVAVVDVPTLDTPATPDVMPPVDAGRCAAQDARGVGGCDLFLGWAWNGASCSGLSGCSCSGADCRALYMSQSECMAAYATCPMPGDCRTAGCPAGRTCMGCRGPGGAGVFVCIPVGAVC